MTRNMLNRQLALAAKRLAEANSQESAESAQAQMDSLNEAIHDLDRIEERAAQRLSELARNV